MEPQMPAETVFVTESTDPVTQSTTTTTTTTSVRPTTETESPTTESGGGVGAGAVAGAVVAVILVVAIVATVLICFFYRRRQKRKLNESSESVEMAPGADTLRRGETQYIKEKFKQMSTDNQRLSNETPPNNPYTRTPHTSEIEARVWGAEGGGVVGAVVGRMMVPVGGRTVEQQQDVSASGNKLVVPGGMVRDRTYDNLPSYDLPAWNEVNAGDLHVQVPARAMQRKPSEVYMVPPRKMSQSTQMAAEEPEMARIGGRKQSEDHIIPGTLKRSCFPRKFSKQTSSSEEPLIPEGDTSASEASLTRNESDVYLAPGGEEAARGMREDSDLYQYPTEQEKQLLNAEYNTLQSSQGSNAGMRREDSDLYQYPTEQGRQNSNVGMKREDSDLYQYPTEQGRQLSNAGMKREDSDLYQYPTSQNQSSQGSNAGMRREDSDIYVAPGSRQGSLGGGAMQREESETYLGPQSRHGSIQSGQNGGGMSRDESDTYLPVQEWRSDSVGSRGALGRRRSSENDENLYFAMDCKSTKPAAKPIPAVRQAYHQQRRPTLTPLAEEGAGGENERKLDDSQDIYANMNTIAAMRRKESYPGDLALPPMYVPPRKQDQLPPARAKFIV